MTKSYTYRRRPSWIEVVVLCIVVAAASIFGTGLYLSSRYNNLLEKTIGSYDKLEEIRKLLDTYYVGEYTEEELMDMLSAGYIAGINDKWAYYTSAKDLAALQESQTGRYAGIGVSVIIDGDTGLLNVLEVYENSPAEKAGLKVLDQIYAVEGEEVAGLGLEAAASKVRGTPGTKVKITIKRDGAFQDLEIERAEVERQSVKAELIDGEVGYIRISDFSVVAAEQFTQKLKNLMTLNAKYLIIDVRNNPGGSLNTLLSILDEVMPGGVLFAEQEKGKELKEISARDNIYNDLPLVVLANAYSYSAAEYFAAVTQESGRAYVIGNHTTGKGEGQSTFTLSDGSAVTFSTIKYYTPKGKSLSVQEGIAPDLEVELTDEQTSMIGIADYPDDPHIVRALEHFRSGTGQ